MNRIKLGAFCSFLLLTSFCFSQEKPVKNDSITLTQVYINTSLTNEYFDSLPKQRLESILPFLDAELKSIKDTTFLNANPGVIGFTKSLWFFNKSQFDFKFNDTLDRPKLVSLHNSLKQSMDLYNESARHVRRKLFEENVFFDLMKFDMESYFGQQGNVLGLKGKYQSLFNANVAPDFENLVLAAKYKNHYGFKELTALTEQFSFAFQHHILESGNQDYLRQTESKLGYCSPYYDMDEKLHGMAQFIQLRYIMYEENIQLPVELDINMLYMNFYDFEDLMKYNNYFSEDDFFKKELNEEVVKELYEKMLERYPHEYIGIREILNDAAAMPNKPPVKYYFPNPAPMPSARTFISDYKPDLKKLGDVDEYLKPLFYAAGYKDHLHYYYSIDGYAMLSSLEKFNKNGESVEEDKRWISAFDQGKFSYYQIFKSIFFEVETEFRMIALVVASKNIRISSMPMTAQMAENLMANSYSELPEDLKNVELTPKNMSVLVYHFHQDDIGKVPKLNLDGEHSVKDYLETAKLGSLIED